MKIHKLMQIFAIVSLIVLLFAGCKSEQGLIGLQGPAGAQGPTGVAGPAGPMGFTGPAGPAGTAGAAGATGPTGATGATGPSGPAGSAGVSTMTSNWADFSPAPTLGTNEYITYAIGSTTLLMTTRDETANPPFDRILKFTSGAWSELLKLPLNKADRLITSPTASTDHIYYYCKVGVVAALTGSKDNDSTWTAMILPPPDAVAYLKTYLFLQNVQSLLWGGTDKIWKTNDSGATWTAYNCPIGKVSCILKAGNKDLVASGIDAAGKVRVARSIYVNDATYGNTWIDVTTPAPLSSAATDTTSHFTLGYPTGNAVGLVVEPVTAGGDSGAWRWSFSTGSWTRIDNGNQVNQGVSATNYQSTTGTPEEGNGVNFILDETTLVRRRGDMICTDRIPGPTGLYKFTLGQSAVSNANGTATLQVLGCTDGDGKAEKIFVYTDNLVQVVSGVKSTLIAPTSMVVNWTTLPYATNYAVFVSKVKQTNYYTAISDPGIVVNYTPGAAVAWVSGLSSPNYYVTVWATNPVTSFYGSTAFTMP